MGNYLLEWLLPIRQILMKMWRKRIPCTLPVGMLIGAANREHSTKVPQIIKNRATMWHINLSFGYLPKNLKTLIHKDIHTPMLIAALFTIAETREKSKCPSTDDWIKKMWYIHIMDYYWAIKNEILQFETTWMNLERIMLSEKDKNHIISLTCEL